jgi:hypothetical protein
MRKAEQNESAFQRKHKREWPIPGETADCAKNKNKCGVQTKVRDVRDKKRGTMTSGQFFVSFWERKGKKGSESWMAGFWEGKVGVENRG